MKKTIIIIVAVVIALAVVGHGAYNYGKNLLNVATQQMQVTKPAPALTQPYEGGLLHYVNGKE